MGITRGQVRALRDAAGQAGDMAQARICDIALGEGGTEEFAELLSATVDGAGRDVIAAMSQDEARAECERVIADAAAQLTDGEK